MVVTYNGMLAAELGDVRWLKSQHSNPNGACVEVPRCERRNRDAQFAIPSRRRPALHSGRDHRISGRRKDGEFDHLLAEAG